MITNIKEIVIYNNINSFNLNLLSNEVKNKIDKIFRTNPTTGQSYQVWSPSSGVIQFSALTCGEIYIIESNSIDYNISDNLIIYDTNLCAPDATPTPTPISTLTPTPTPTPTQIALDNLKVMYIKWT